MSKKSFATQYKEKRKITDPIVNLWIKRIYVTAFNIYAWYWLYREIFIQHTPSFENYLLWFFTTGGMHYFVLDNQDIFFKKKT